MCASAPAFNLAWRARPLLQRNSHRGEQCAAGVHIAVANMPAHDGLHMGFSSANYMSGWLRLPRFSEHFAHFCSQQRPRRRHRYARTVTAADSRWHQPLGPYITGLTPALYQHQPGVCVCSLGSVGMVSGGAVCASRHARLPPCVSAACQVTRATECGRPQEEACTGPHRF